MGWEVMDVIDVLGEECIPGAGMGYNSFYLSSEGGNVKERSRFLLNVVR